MSGGGGAPSRGPGPLSASLASLFSQSPGGGVLERLLQTRLDPAMRFSTFVKGPSNRTAFSAARRIAMQASPPQNPLMIISASGNGRTHLLQSLTKRRRSLFPKERVLYISGESLATEFIHALRRRQEAEFTETVRALDVIALDEVEGLARADSGQHVIAALLEEMLARGGVLAISSGRPPGQTELDRSLVRLIRRAHLAPISSADTALRQSVLEAEADQARRRGRPLLVERRAIVFLARELPLSIGKLKAVLARLSALGEEQGAPASVSTVRDELGDLLLLADRRRRRIARVWRQSQP